MQKGDAEYNALLAKMGLRAMTIYGPGEDDGSHPDSQAAMRRHVEQSKKTPMLFDNQTDWEMGNQIRMLTRDDAEFESLVTACRTRIFKLHLENAALRKKVEVLEEQIGEGYSDDDGPSHVTREEMTEKVLEVLPEMAGKESSLNFSEYHTCSLSPTEMCVYNAAEDPMLDDCLFCHDPHERK